MKENTSKAPQFIVGGSILATAGIIGGIICLFYRIPLADIIGTDGVAYYTSAYAFYYILLTVASYSLPIAVSKLVSARAAAGRLGDVQNIFRASFIYATFFGAIFFAAFWFAAPLIALLFNKSFLVYSLRALAPAAWIMSYAGIFRGYFQGMGTVKPTAFSQIAEQLINAAASLFLAVHFFNYGYKADLIYDETGYSSAYGAMGAMAGAAAGAFSVLVFLLLIYMVYRKDIVYRIRHTRQRKYESAAHIAKSLTATVIPVVLSAVLFNITIALDDIIFSRSAGAAEQAVSQWGTFGKFVIIFYIPLMIANSVGASLIPSLSAAAARRDKKRIVKNIRGSLRFIMLLSLPLCAVLFSLSEPLSLLLFGSEDIELLKGVMMLGSFMIIVFGLSAVTSGILQGLGHVTEPLINSASALTIHIILLLALTLVFKTGIYAVIISNIAFGLIISGLNTVCIHRHVRFRQNFSKTFLKPALSAAAGGAAVCFVNFIYKLMVSEAFYASTAGLIVIIAVGAAVFFAVYLTLLRTAGAFAGGRSFH